MAEHNGNKQKDIEAWCDELASALVADFSVDERQIETVSFSEIPTSASLDDFEQVFLVRLRSKSTKNTSVPETWRGFFVCYETPMQ